MARMFTAETLLQGRALSSVGARACEPGRSLEHEARSGRRSIAVVGDPGNRW